MTRSPHNSSVIDQIREHLPILRCPLSKQSLRELEMWETDRIELVHSKERMSAS